MERLFRRRVLWLNLFVKAMYVVPLKKPLLAIMLILITVWNNGREDEIRIPFRTKEEAEEKVESFVSGSFTPENH